MEKNRSVLASIFGKMATDIKSGNYTEEGFQTQREQFKKELYSISNNAKPKRVINKPVAKKSTNPIKSKPIAMAVLPEKSEDMQMVLDKITPDKMFNKIHVQRATRSKNPIPKKEGSIFNKNTDVKPKYSLWEKIKRQRAARKKGGGSMS